MIDTGTGTPRVKVSNRVHKLDEGGSATYTVRLDTRPAGQVTVALASGDADAVSVSPPGLTFETGNWRDAQTVTVRGVADTDLDDETVSITHAVAGYGRVTAALPARVEVTDTGTGAGGVTMTPASLTVEENSRATWTVRLNDRPGGRVTVTLVIANPSVVVSPRTLYFDATNWKTAQSVIASSGGEDDDIRDVTMELRVLMADKVVNRFPVTLVDTGRWYPAVAVSPLKLAVDEGGSATYRVRLDRRPSGTVKVTATSGAGDTATVAPGTLTFVAANWRTQQTVTVRGLADTDLDDDTVTITHGVSGYSGVTSVAPVKVTVTDTGTGTDGVVVAPLSLTIGEEGSASYGVRLDTRPGGKVTVTPASGDPGAATVMPVTLTFAAANWKTEQTVTVSGVADTDADDEDLQVTHQVSGYRGVTTADPVTVEVTDPHARNAELSGLTLSAGTLAPTLAAGRIIYRAVVDHAVSAVTVTPTSTNPRATILVNSARVASGSPSDPMSLRAGERTWIPVEVRARLAQRTIFLGVHRKGSAELSGLELTRYAASFPNFPAALTPSFAAGTTSYTAKLEESVVGVKVKATPADAAATVAVNGESGTERDIWLGHGITGLTVAVTAVDRLTKKTYTVSIPKLPASSNAELSGLEISAGTLSPAFRGDRTAYGVDVAYRDTVTLTPTAAHRYAAIRVDGTRVASGAASTSLGVRGGKSREVPVAVTAEDGTVKSYRVTVARAKASNNAALDGLKISAGALSPSFTSTTTYYTVAVAYPAARTTVTPTAAHAGAAITVDGSPVASGTASATIDLPAGGSRTLTVGVTAETGATKTYRVKVTRALPVLLGLELYARRVPRPCSAAPSETI